MTTTEQAVIPNDERLALARRTVAKDLNDDNWALYLHDCHRHGVHPLDRLIHPTVRKDKWGNERYTPITSIDFMRQAAARSGEMAGSDDAVFQDDGIGKPKAATVTVWRITQGQRCAYSATARWDEYYPGDGNVGMMWRKLPHVMLAKCAEALALRKGFPAETAGLYAREEMDQAGADAPSGEREKQGAKRVGNGGAVKDDGAANGKAATEPDHFASEEAYREHFKMEPDEEDLLRIEQNQMTQARVAMMGLIGTLCESVPDVVKDLGFSPKTLPRWGKLTDPQKEEKRRFLSEICGLPGGYNEGTSRQWREAEARVREKYLPPA
jgi:phage recombination protein Bet